MKLFHLYGASRIQRTKLLCICWKLSWCQLPFPFLPSYLRLSYVVWKCTDEIERVAPCSKYFGIGKGIMQTAWPISHSLPGSSFLWRWRWKYISYERRTDHLKTNFPRSSLYHGRTLYTSATGVITDRHALSYSYQKRQNPPSVI